MKYFNFILIFSIAFSMETHNTYNNKLLFCLKSSVEPLSIAKENNTNLPIEPIIIDHWNRIK